jgi:predicted MFS family arabinose efflux permease
MRMITNGPVAKLAVSWVTMFLVGTDLFVVSPLLPLIAGDLAISPALTGLGVAVFALTYMITAPLLGDLADRVGRRRMLILCLYAFAVANLLTAGATSLGWLLAARLCAGAATAGVSPSVYALVTGITPGDRRATWLAVVLSGLLVSLSLGASIGALVGACIGWPNVFAVLAGLSLLLGWVNRRMWPEDKTIGDGAAQSGAPSIAVLAPRLAPTVAWSTALYGMYTYLGVGLSSAGFSSGEIAEVISFYGCGAIAGVLLGGRAADLLGAKPTSGISLAGFCACLLLLRLALHEGVLVDLAFGLASAVAQMFFPAQQASLANDFPARRATVLAWNNSALFLGITLGSLIGGQGVRLGGFAGDLTISAAIALAGWGLNWAIAPPPTGAAVTHPRGRRPEAG